MAKRIRVGIVGHGYFGAFHAKHYAANPMAELMAIADPSEAKAELIRGVYGDRRRHDYRELLGLVDAVSIAAPTGLHHQIAGDFIDAGIHVLVEKPLAATAGDAKDLVARAEGAGVILHVGHIERFSPAYRVLRDAVSKPLLVDARRHSLWSGRVTDVDVVLDLMIHDIDLVLDLVGEAPATVMASGVAVMGHGLDAVMARVSFPGGATAHISASRIAAAQSRVLSVHEAGRTLTADLGARTVSEFTPGQSAPAPLEVPSGDALGAEIAAFLDAIAGRGGSGVGGRGALAALLLAEAIRDDAEKRHRSGR